MWSKLGQPSGRKAKATREETGGWGMEMSKQTSLALATDRVQSDMTWPQQSLSGTFPVCFLFRVMTPVSPDLLPAQLGLLV